MNKKQFIKYLPILALLFTACSLPLLIGEGDLDEAGTAAPAAAGTLPPTPDIHAETVWLPPVGTSWQIQFTGDAVDQTYDVDVYDIDLFDNDASIIDALHAQGHKVFCYMSAGSWEDWRPDQDQFPIETLGNDYEDWEGEKWLDIRQVETLAPVMQARLDLCKEKGFDGVEADNVDGYTNDTGFPLTYEDQIAYNTWLANEAHSRGLSIGLKNDPGQAADLVSFFDWALTEDCFAEGWCGDLQVFTAAGKAVFAIEYTDTGAALESFCPQAKELGFSAILKNRELDAFMESCQ